MEYVVPVTIGSPGVTVNLDFDTGSSDLWIWSSELANASKTLPMHRQSLDAIDFLPPDFSFP